MKNIAYFHEFQKMYLYKDLFLIPYYIAKEQGIDLDFCYSYNMANEQIPQEYRGVRLLSAGRERTNIITRSIDFFHFCTLRARTIRTLFVAGVDNFIILQLLIIKCLNSKCKIVVFGDMEADRAKELTKRDFVMSSGIKGLVKKQLVNLYFRNVIYTVASTTSYLLMKDMFKRNSWTNLVHIYPCLDKELFDAYGLSYRPFKKKENIILYVGRIGNYQKNTDMMLEAFTKVDFRDWKVFLIGPFTDSFFLKEKSSYEDTIKTYFANFPHLKKHVVFTGPIYNPKTIFEHYLQSKVFLLTSRHEGFANVQSEAAALGCFIVSTDVGGADLVSNNWRFGVKIEQNNADELANVLNNIIEGKVKIDESKRVPQEKFEYRSLIHENLIPLLDNVWR